MSAEHCPSCQQIDQIRKVSAVVAQGTQNTSAIHEHKRSVSIESGVSQTNLAEHLARPRAPGISGWVSLLLLTSGTVGFVFALVFGCFLGGIVVSRFEITGFTAWIIVFLGMGFGVFGLRKLTAWLRSLLESKPRPVELAWKQADQRWQQLYYCGRCDAAFIPNQTDAIPLPEIRQFLYS